MTLPTREEAHKIVMGMGDFPYIKRHYMQCFAHYLRVAKNAEAIAKTLAHLDSEKAYIIGLLHDYGKIDELQDKNIFHGLSGYKRLMTMGYDEAARAALVHSFFEKETITPERYQSYNRNDIIECANLLAKTPFDDYDRLVHLADLLAMSTQATTIEARFEYLAVTYDIDDELLKDKYALACDLKDYFDNLCGCDVYDLLNVAHHSS